MGLRLADRKAVAGHLLDELYGQGLEQLKAETKGGMVTMSIDGWSTVQNEPVVGIALSSDTTTYLVDTVDTSGKPHTGQYIVELADEKIDEVESGFETEVVDLTWPVPESR